MPVCYLELTLLGIATSARNTCVLALLGQTGAEGLEDGGVSNIPTTKGMSMILLDAAQQARDAALWRHLHRFERCSRGPLLMEPQRQRKEAGRPTP